MSEAFGPGWGFVKAWMEAWVSAPGSIAGIAIVFGEFVAEFLGEASGPPQLWAVVAVAVFASINLMGVRWGGRTQVTLTTIKITGVLTLVIGSFFFAEAVAPSAAPASSVGLAALLRFVGIGVAAVFFTYDGWTDVTHVAGEVANPKKTLPLGLGLGVFGIMVLYLIVNLAFLRVMPLAVMREQGATVAITLAGATFGATAGQVVSGLIMISIFGALGGLVMTAPRVVYAPAAQYEKLRQGRSGTRRAQRAGLCLATLGRSRRCRRLVRGALGGRHRFFSNVRPAGVLHSRTLAAHERGDRRRGLPATGACAPEQ